MDYTRNEDRRIAYTGPLVNIIHEVKDISDSSPTADDEPVSVQELKDYLRLEGFEDVGAAEAAYTDEDDLIADTIQAAREDIEQFTRLSLIPKTLKALVTNLCGHIELPGGPVTGDVTAVYEDESGDVDIETSGFDFPKLKTTGEKMILTYEAGYGANIPKPLKRAILAQAAYLFTNRGETEEEKGVCNAARVLARKYRRGSWLL